MTRISLTKRRPMSIFTWVKVVPTPTGPGEVWRDPDETAVYSVMAADSVEITSSALACARSVVSNSAAPFPSQSSELS